MQIEYRNASALLRLTIESSLRADAWALRKLAQYSNGKVILWSWASRGLIDCEWIADLYHKGDVQAAKDSLACTRGKLAELCKLDSLPLLDGAEDPPSNNPETEMLEGETRCFWAISDSTAAGSAPIPLPLWMRAPIDRAVLVWRGLAAKWQEKIAKRELEGKELPPKQRKQYDEFQSSTTRSIVLDKNRKSQVMNIAAKSVRSLKKHCILLVIHMSEDPDSLGMTTGCGKLWKLRLLQHSQPISDHIPVEVDHFDEGQYCAAPKS